MILVPSTVDVEGVPYSIVQLAESVEARVFVEQNGQRIQSTNRVTIGPGWWLIPPNPEGNDR